MKSAEEIMAEADAASLAQVRAIAAATRTRWDDPQVAADLDELAERRALRPGEEPF